MTKSLIHPIEAETSTKTWLKAAKYLTGQQDRTQFNVILGVRKPVDLAAEDFRVHDVVDAFLQDHGKQSLVTTAGTIFPGGLYLQGGAQAVFGEFPGLYKKFKTGWGTYAGRIFCPTLGPKGKERSPMEVLIEKLKSQSKKGHMRAAYEAKVFDEMDTLELSTYQPESDCRLTIGQPCLTHLSFKLHRDNSVSLTAFYRTHYYIEKTLGNLLGLGQLLKFVADEAELEVGSLVCHSTMAELDTATTKKGIQGWTQADVDILLRDCDAQYASLPRATQVV